VDHPVHYIIIVQDKERTITPRSVLQWIRARRNPAEGLNRDRLDLYTARYTHTHTHINITAM